MSVKIDEWKNLDSTDRIVMENSIPQLARELVNMNRGVHRMLSALVHALREERQRCPLPGDDPQSPLADAIEETLNRGIYY